MRVRRLALAAALLVPAAARAEWARDSTSLAWKANGAVVWRFSFDPKFGKPYFEPVSVAGGPSLTNFKPEDHPWHYGLWFSWKYINKVNYWEESRQSGQAAGATRWGAPQIETRPDGSARIRMTVTYARPTGEVDLTEARELRVSAPDAGGAYTIDWSARFTAGKDGAELGRTPMPGEPGGAINGGYAGLSVRLAASPLTWSVASTEGPVTEFVRDRARPNAAAVAANFALDGKDAGALAILSAPVNAGSAAGAGEKAPWYVINQVQQDFRFVCAAVLAPAVRTIPAGGTMDLRYRVALRRAAWTPESLGAATRAWLATLVKGEVPAPNARP